MSRRRSRRRRKPPRIQRLTSPGAIPGTVRVAGDAEPTVMRVMQYSRDVFVEELVSSVPQIATYLHDDTVTWVDITGLRDVAMLKELRAAFGLHELALEDVVNVHQRAKVEEYTDHLFIVVRAAARHGQLETTQLSIFLGRNYVLSIQSKACEALTPVRNRLRKARGKMRESTADYLTYALLDAVIDAYFPVVDDYGEQLERLDERVTAGKSNHVMAALHDLRGDLMLLRRSLRPLRDSLVRLIPDATALIRPETQPYLRDCFDHTVQLLDLLDTYRELCSDLRDYCMSAVSNRMNEIMKVLTIISTIFIPLSFIASVYGMNFDTSLPGNMPELKLPYAYLVTLLTMGLLAGSLVGFIWHKGWLGDGSVPPDAAEEVVGEETIR